MTPHKNVAFFHSQLLLDNSASFTSSRMKDFCQKWKVKLIFRGAYRLSGTWIVEKNHRTIKRMAARSGGESPLVTNLTDPEAPYFTTDLRHRRPYRQWWKELFSGAEMGWSLRERVGMGIGEGWGWGGICVVVQLSIERRAYVSEILLLNCPNSAVDRRPSLLWSKRLTKCSARSSG